MKIYTEINYKWLDGQLVKTDSKSFEYEGELTLCVGGSLGTALGSVGLGAVTTNAQGGGSTADQVLGDVINPGGVNDIVSDNIQAGMEGVQSNLESLEGTPNIEGLGMNEGVATTAGDFGENINTNMNPITAEADRWGDAATTNMQYGMEFLSEKQKELAGITNDPAAVTIEKDKFAVDASKKKKNRSDLAVNKAKTRARKSLRIS